MGGVSGFVDTLEKGRKRKEFLRVDSLVTL